MDLLGSVQYRGRKIYLNRKKLLESGQWKWTQEATGLDRGDENAAGDLLEERNASELARYELRAVVVRSKCRVGTSSSPETLRQFSELWVANRKARQFTSAFDDERRFQLHILPFVIEGVSALGDLPLRHVRPIHIRAWITAVEQKGLAARTVRNLYSMLHAMFADAYADERVDSSPCRLRRGDLPGSEDKDPRWRGTAVFTREELVALITDRRIPIDRRALYAVAFLGAARSGELSALRVGDYDRTLRPLPRLTVAESYSIHLKRAKRTKTGITRMVPVHPVLQHVLDEWLGHGFKELFGREPRATDLMFPARANGQPNVGRFDYGAELAREPALTRAALARRLGVSRAAVTQGLRRVWRHEGHLEMAYRGPKTNYVRLQDDLDRLGFRRRRLHDAKRTAVSLLTEDGARDPILTYIVWGPRKNVRDLYITLPWDVFCQEILRLKLPAFGGGAPPPNVE